MNNLSDMYDSEHHTLNTQAKFPLQFPCHLKHFDFIFYIAFCTDFAYVKIIYFIQSSLFCFALEVRIHFQLTQ